MTSFDYTVPPEQNDPHRSDQEVEVKGFILNGKNTSEKNQKKKQVNCEKTGTTWPE